MDSVVGKKMFSLMRELYPICRSITGDGVRKTLSILKKEIPIDVLEVPTGTKVFDWTIPKEWNIKDAYVLGPNGEKVIDFKKSNLHVLNYSTPVNKKMPLEELKKHLYSLEQYPNWIPYLTTYYSENWGFCLSDNQLKKLKKGVYRAVIDSSLEKGSLTYGELFIKGKSRKEVLFSCYVCHPSMCNDNLSGVVLLTFLAKHLLANKSKLNYSYRFLFIPETIGAITWLSKNEGKVKNVSHGLVATCVADKGIPTYKKSRQQIAEIDKVVEIILRDSGKPFNLIDFFPSGSDERQFCSPGFNLPVGSLMRTPYANYAQYHTSADDLDFVDSQSLSDSLSKYLEVVFVLENNATYVNLNPKCEPQLGKRGLYSKIGAKKDGKIDELALFWVLNQSDGKNSLLDVSIRSKICFKQIKLAADSLAAAGLLKPINGIS